jgi:hypothetical protein
VATRSRWSAGDQSEVDAHPNDQQIADMMAKDPAKRIQSAAEVMVRLAPWAEGKGRGAEGTGRGARGEGRDGGSSIINHQSSINPATAKPGAQKNQTPRLRDTEPDFPEIVESGRGDKDSSSQELPAGDPLGWSHPAAAPMIDVNVELPAEPLSILRPLVVFVLLPLVLVAVVVLLRWLGEILG